MTGAEPALSAWKAEVLPLNYIRMITFKWAITIHYVELKSQISLARFELAINDKNGTLGVEPRSLVDSTE